jgi:hypothetical protein
MFMSDTIYKGGIEPDDAIAALDYMDRHRQINSKMHETENQKALSMLQTVKEVNRLRKRLSDESPLLSQDILPIMMRLLAKILADIDSNEIPKNHPFLVIEYESRTYALHDVVQVLGPLFCRQKLAADRRVHADQAKKNRELESAASMTDPEMQIQLALFEVFDEDVILALTAREIYNLQQLTDNGMKVLENIRKRRDALLEHADKSPKGIQDIINKYKLVTDEQEKKLCQLLDAYKVHTFGLGLNVQMRDERLCSLLEQLRKAGP